MSSGGNGLKSIFVNGILVGQVPATGDLESDVEAVREFMKARGLTAPSNPFRAIQGQAIAFANSAHAIYERFLSTTPTRNGLTGVPFVVNSAFSIELYLKTLHEVHGTPQRGHRLLPLYDALPATTRATLESAAATSARDYLPPDEAVRTFKFRDFISDLDNAFVEWRYAHEAGRTPLVKFHPTILVMAVLHKVSQDMVAQHDAAANPVSTR
jgi:hypothetical protein